MKKLNQDLTNDELRRRFTAYIEKVVRHAKIDYLRKLNYKKNEIPMDGLPEDAFVTYDVQAVEPLRNKEFVFEEERISQAFMKLPLLRQRILTLLFVQDMPAQEIAEQLNCSVQYVYKQKHLALKKLKALLSQEDSRFDR